MNRLNELTRAFGELPPLGLYVHIPWCERKCPYCDFNSHERREPVDEAAYVDALLEDLATEMPLVWGRSVTSVFIGGGTPSLFSPGAIDRLLSGIRALTALSPTIEITMEANPGSIDRERFTEFRRAGINRLSIGVQSFDTDSLVRLGRIHDGEDARRAIDIARAAGFETLNIDLMVALPEQSLAACLHDIDTALQFSPEHLSCYELTLEPNTRFARFPPTLPDEELRWRMQDAVHQRLAAAGYERYEISAFARGKHRSVHNLNYWRFGDYLGIGAGAHGKISSAATGEIRRRWKVRHPSRYLAARDASTRVAGDSAITIDDTAVEFMMNALRLIDGFPIPLFRSHTGIDLNPWQDAIERAKADGLLEQHGLDLSASARGLDLLNDLVGYFLPAPTTGTGSRHPVISLQPIP